MSINEKPNLFNFATSELSQDAFLCWLFSWFAPDVKHKDRVLYNLVKNILKKIFDMHGEKFPKKIKSFEIEKQYKNIDILLKINKNIAIIIEDKIHSKQHSGQLTRYHETIKEEKTYSKILPIYFQMGQQSNYDAVKKAKYEIFLRKDFLDILNKVKNSDNNILLDYISYLNDIEDNYQSYNNLQLDEWKDYSWQGFYSELKNRLEDGDWDYVSNPRGGFYGFWWHWNSHINQHLYLQLEEKKLCFKIEVKKVEERYEMMYKYQKIIMDVKIKSILEVVKPSRLRRGEWMTVAIMNDYRQTDKNGMLDMKKTLSIIREAEAILDEAVK